MGYFNTTSCSSASTCESVVPILQRRISPGLKPLTRVSPLSVLGLRYYKPELSCWINRDPIGELGFSLLSAIDEPNVAMNFSAFSISAVEAQSRKYLSSSNRQELSYTFEENNPCNSIDPFGLQTRREDCKSPKVWRERSQAPACPIDGCSVPAIVPGKPNNPSGACSFEGACGIHDVCYCECQMTKSDCDKQFRDNLWDACANCAKNGNFNNYKELAKCLTWAARYARAVSEGGIGGKKAGKAYDEKQNVNCECVCP